MLNKFTVVLDAGHGGTELADGSAPNNAVGENGLLEKDLTLKIARLASEKLSANGFHTVLTRNGDHNPALSTRARKSLEVGADAFISIHFNGHRRTDIDGTEVFIAKSADEKALQLADELVKRVAAVAEIPSRGVRRTNFTILKAAHFLPKTSACLIEMAYLTNPKQARKLTSDAYLNQLSTALVQAVATFAVQTAFAKPLAEIVKEQSEPKNYPLDFSDSGATRQSFSFDENLGVGDFRTLDFRADAFEAECRNPSDIKRGESFLKFAAMATRSDRADKAENVFLRWCDIPKKACEIDVVVHFHGWDIRGVKKNFFDYLMPTSGLDLFNADGSPVRGRPTLGILPFGQSYKLDDPQDTRTPYSFPFLADRADGLPQLIDFALKYLGDKNSALFSLGRLIVTAHSGGGAAVSKILAAQMKGKLVLSGGKSDLDEIHLFDSTYGDQKNFVNWALSKMNGAKAQNGALRVLYQPFNDRCKSSGTTAGAVQIAKGIGDKTRTDNKLTARYRVEPTRISHLQVPKIFGSQLLRDASADLSDASAPKTAVHPCCEKSPQECGVKTSGQQGFERSGNETDYFANSETNFMNY